MTLFPIRTWASNVVLAAALIAPTAMARGQAAENKTAAAPATAAAATTTTSAATQPATSASSTSAAEPTTSATQPTTAATASDWWQVMNRLASVLAGSDLTALAKVMDPAPVIRAFASDALQTPERLLGATTGSTVLGVHAYERAPATLATDLADDFGSAGDAVPQHVREGMLPPDDAGAKRANETAGQWVVQVLQPHKDDVVGVIVLWPQTKGRSLAAAPTRATFVLVKAHKIDGDYVLRQITFGDPLETPK